MGERVKVKAGWLFGPAFLLLVAGIAFVVLRSVIAPNPEVDFRFFWFAGYMWAHGLDPYSASYATLSQDILPPGNRTSAWVYPPHWWPICRAVATLSLDQAVAIWRLLSGAMIIGGTWVMARALFADRGQLGIAVTAAAAGIACLIEPTAMVLALGQNSAFIYLGFCLLVSGHIRSSTSLTVAAIVLLSLKPNIGVPVILGLFFVPAYRVPILIAAAIGFLMALPHLLSFGPIDTFRGLMGNLAGYSGPGMTAEENPNIPVSSTGVMNLLGHAFPSLPSYPGYIAGLLAAPIVGLAMRGRDRDAQLRLLLLLITLLIVVLPLHVYDIGVILIPVLMLVALRPQIGVVSLFALLASFRPSNVEAMLDMPIYGGGVSVGAVGLSLALMFVAMLVVLMFLTEKRTPPSGAPAFQRR